MQVLKVKNIVCCKANIWNELKLKCICGCIFKIDCFITKEKTIFADKICPLCKRYINIDKKEIIRKWNKIHM